MNNCDRRSLPRAIAAVLIGVGALTVFPDAGHAVLTIDSNRYCSTGINSSITADTVPGGLLSMGDVTLTITSPPNPQYVASNCYGDFDPGNSSPANETSALNQIFGSDLLFLDETGGGSDRPSAWLRGPERRHRERPWCGC